MAAQFFEDFAPGDRFETQGYTMTEGEIIDFALRYDPQYFHLDKDAAERSIYGGLIASGWQVGALGFRLFLQLNVFGENSLGSPGLDELRWTRPVRPGDTIRMQARVLEVRASRSKPDRGNVVMEWKVVNQRDEAVMTFRSVQMLKRRPAAQ